MFILKNEGSAFLLNFECIPAFTVYARSSIADCTDRCVTSSQCVEVVAMLRKHGVNETLVMKVWDLRSALLENEQLCLSRFQVCLTMKLLSL